VPPPELVVLDVVGGDGVRPGEVEEQDRRPQDFVAVRPTTAHEEADTTAAVGPRTCLLLPSEEGGEGVDRQCKASLPRKANQISEPQAGCRDRTPTVDCSKSKEVPQEVAAEDEDSELPLFPPHHCT
jgi:hypothetical protein